MMDALAAAMGKALSLTVCRMTESIPYPAYLIYPRFSPQYIYHFINR